MTTETFSQQTSTTPNASKTWLAIGVMFIAGVAGGALAIHLLSRSEPQHVVAANSDLTQNSAPTSPQNPSGVNTGTQEEIRELREEVELLRTAAQLNGSQANGESSSATGSRQTEVAGRRTIVRQPSAAAAEGKRTLAYWNALNSIMTREAAMRAAPPQLTAGNAMSFVSSQSTAYEYAASAIRQLETQGVDPQVVGIAREIAAWYDEGIANSRNAESLLGSNDIAARQGAAGQAWSSAEKSHREKCLAINRQGEQLRQELNRRYGLEFPPMQ